MERESSLMYRSTWEILQDIRTENVDNYVYCLDIYYDYAFNGNEPDLNGKPMVVKLFWKAAKPLIDANNRNYVNGSKGGAPTGNQNASKQPKNNPKTTQKQPKGSQKTTQKQGNDNVNDNVNVNVHEHVNENDNVHVNVNDNENENILIDSSEDEDDGWIIPYQDENGNWVTG